MPIYQMQNIGGIETLVLLDDGQMILYFFAFMTAISVGITVMNFIKNLTLHFTS